MPLWRWRVDEPKEVVPPVVEAPVLPQAQEIFEPAALEVPPTLVEEPAQDEPVIEPMLVYECATTGRIITEANLELLTEEELTEWNEAVEKHFVKDAS